MRDIASGCGRKVRFDRRRTAADQIARLVKLGLARPGELTIYRCDVCSGYHIGRSHRLKRQGRRKLRGLPRDWHKPEEGLRDG